MATETTTERVLSVDGLAFDSRVYTFDAGPRKFDRHEVRLINERYSCTLSDKSDNNQFILSGQPTMHDQLPGFVRDGDNRLLCRLPWLVPTGTFCVPDLIDPEFTQVPKIEELGDGLLRVPFRVREGLPADKQERLRGMVAGALVLNRNKHYRLESAEIQLNQQSYTATLRFTYESPPREEFLLKGIEQDSKWSGVVPMAGRQVWEFECREVDDDPRRFYMSHYGLPEPVGVVPPTRPPPRYAWWLGGAAVFAVVALVARWAGKQRSRAGSDTPTPTG